MDEVIQFEPFYLFSPRNDSIDKAIELIENFSLSKYRVCVVSIISKCAINSSVKEHIISSLIGEKNEPALTEESSDLKSDNNVNLDLRKSGSTGPELSDGQEIQISGHIDTKSGLILMNLTSLLETNKLASLCDSLDRYFLPGNDRTSGFEVWPIWNQNLIKALLILFVMSHVIVFYHPQPCLDLNLVHILKILDAFRQRSQLRLTDLLEAVASKRMFSPHWIRQGRVSCPRALFVYDTTSSRIKLKPTDMIQAKRDLEDQIHRVMKRTNLAKRTASNRSTSAASTAGSSLSQKSAALLHLPEDDDFVFLLNDRDFMPGTVRPWNNSPRMEQEKSRPHQQDEAFYEDLFRSLNLGGKDHILSEQMPTAACSATQDGSRTSGNQADATEVQTQSLKVKNRLKKFLNHHIVEIQTRAHDEQSNLNLPRYDDFFRVLTSLKSLLFPGDCDSSDDDTSSWLVPDERRFVDIYDQLDIDRLFSERHCSKTREAAFDFYRQSHKVGSVNQRSNTDARLSAIKLYNNHARGPAVKKNLALLLDQCNDFWKDFSSTKLPESGKSQNERNSAASTSHKLASKPGLVKGGRSNANKANSNSKATGDQVLLIRKGNGLIINSNCDCGRSLSLSVVPLERKKKLERVTVTKVQDREQSSARAHE